MPNEHAYYPQLGIGESDCTEEAIGWLSDAVDLAPGRPRFAYVLGVALNSSGDGDQAIGALEAAVRSHPYDRDLLTLLAMLHRDRGERALAIGYAERLVEVDPDAPGASQFLAELRGPPG